MRFALVKMQFLQKQSLTVVEKLLGGIKCGVHPNSAQFLVRLTPRHEFPIYPVASRSATDANQICAERSRRRFVLFRSLTAAAKPREVAAFNFDNDILLTFGNADVTPFFGVAQPDASFSATVNGVQNSRLMEQFPVRC